MPSPLFSADAGKETMTSSPMLFGLQLIGFAGPGYWTVIEFLRESGIEPDEASTVFCRTSDATAPVAAGRPPSRTAVRRDWTCRKASPNSMMPNTRMKSSGASRAISTAEAPSSRRSALRTEPLCVDRLERLVERDRLGGGALLDRLVVHAGVVQLLARLQ